MVITTVYFPCVIFLYITDYERKHNIPKGTVVKEILGGYRGDTDWAKMERGEITGAELGHRMTKTLSDMVGIPVVYGLHAKLC